MGLAFGQHDLGNCTCRAESGEPPGIREKSCRSRACRLDREGSEMFGKARAPRTDHLIPWLEYAAQLSADPATNEPGMAAVTLGQQLRNGRRLTVLACRKNNSVVGPVHQTRSRKITFK
jgi:hypothetical protein